MKKQNKIENTNNTNTNNTETNTKIEILQQEVKKALEELFKPVRVLRENLSPSEIESKNLLETHGIPLPDSFFTVRVDSEKVKEAIGILSAMLPKGKGGKKAGQPSEANPAIGWLQSARSRLRTARKSGKTEFNSGERFRKLFTFGIEKVNPQIDAEYNALMSALKDAIASGGSDQK